MNIYILAELNTQDLELFPRIEVAFESLNALKKHTKTCCNTPVMWSDEDNFEEWAEENDAEASNWDYAAYDNSGKLIFGVIVCKLIKK